MNNVYPSREILYWISQMPIAKDLYLEGGAALSLVYKIERRFSGDLDFTVPNHKVIRIFKEEYHSFVKRPEYYIVFTNSFDKNSPRLSLIGREIQSFHLDFTVVENNLFDWCWAKIPTRKGDIVIKTHTLEDITAEKICGVLSPDRFEYKDVIDINKAALRVSLTKLEDLTLSKIKVKLLVTKKDILADLFVIKRQNFLENAFLNAYPLKSFDKNYLEVTNLIEKLLLK